MSNQFKNPIFWCFIAIVLGMALGIWGLIKTDCIGGPGCWIGSGFLKISGGALIVAGLVGWAVLSNRPKSN